MTNALLTIIIIIMLYQVALKRHEHRQVMEHLDALAEMMGDMLRELITKIDKDK